jgi:hypothetical protein
MRRYRTPLRFFSQEVGVHFLNACSAAWILALGTSLFFLFFY